MITGLHSIVYSTDAEATRAFFRDVFGWRSLDAGGGWLIFKTPPSELGVHPTSDEPQDPWATTPFHQLALMCEDIHATIEQLQERSVSVKGEAEDQGFGLVTSIDVPGAGWMVLYQPRHELAYEIEDAAE